MKIFALLLLVVLVLLQWRLWVSDEGLRGVRRLEAAVAHQREENARLRARNEQLAAEVKDLKEGLAALEERARSELGMIGPDEVFYQVVPPEPPPDAGEPPEGPPARQAARPQ